MRDYGTLQFGLLKGPAKLRPEAKTTLIKLRASLLPIIFSIILPWALFASLACCNSLSSGPQLSSQALTYTSVASSVHLSDPWQSILGVACGGLLLICFFFAWLDRMVNSPDRAPSQLGFFGFSFLLAWLLGIVLGSVSYQSWLDTLDPLDLFTISQSIKSQFAISIHFVICHHVPLVSFLTSKKVTSIALSLFMWLRYTLKWFERLGLARHASACEDYATQHLQRPPDVLPFLSFQVWIQTSPGAVSKRLTVKM